MKSLRMFATILSLRHWLLKDFAMLESSYECRLVPVFTGQQIAFYYEKSKISSQLRPRRQTPSPSLRYFFLEELIGLDRSLGGSVLLWASIHNSTLSSSSYRSISETSSLRFTFCFSLSFSILELKRELSGVGCNILYKLSRALNSLIY